MSKRDEVLAEIEALRHATATPTETELSIGDWCGRVQGFTKEAFQCARAGQVELEYEAWKNIAAVCVGKMEDLLTIIDGDETREVISATEEKLIAMALDPMGDVGHDG